MAATSNQIMRRKDGRRASYPVAATTRIYEGTLVFVNAAGFAVDVTATGVNGFAGVAVREVDNSSGDAGDLSVEVYCDGDFELVGSGFAQADVHSVAYAEDNFAIGVSISSASVPIGRVIEFVSSTRLVVRIKPTGVGALPVAALTTITPADAVGTPDYAIQAVINSSAYGFASAQELISFLYVVQNLQIRVAQLEARAL